MCKIGDIIVIEKYTAENNKQVSMHSFIVVDDQHGIISGLNYDIVTNVISSFKNEEHKIKKLSFKENLEISNNDLKFNKKLKRSSYIKADKLFYFNKRKIKYYKIGKLDNIFFNKLLIRIDELTKENKSIPITKNL